MFIATTGHKKGSVVTKRKFAKIIMITVMAAMLSPLPAVKAAEPDELQDPSAVIEETEIESKGLEMEGNALVHIELLVPEGFTDPVDISLTRDEQNSYDARLLPWDDYKKDIAVSEGEFRLSGMVTSDILCRYFTIQFQSINFVIEAGDEKTICAEVVPVSADVEAPGVAAQEIEERPQQTEVVPEEAEEKEEEVSPEKGINNHKEKAMLITMVMFINIAAIIALIWLRRNSYNEGFKRVTKIVLILLIITLVMLCVLSAMSYFKDRRFKVPDEEIEEIDGREEKDSELDLESYTGILKNPNSELGEEESESDILVVGEHALQPVYAGNDTYYGVYGYAGSLFKPSYDTWKAAKEADAVEVNGTDEWTGRSIRTIAGTKYVYSGVVRVDLDEKGKIPVEFRLGFRNEDGYWTPCYQDKEDYNKNKEAFEKGSSIMRSGAWEEGTILCNGMFVSQPYVIEEERYWIPIEALGGKLPYEIGINDSGDAYIQYEFTQGIIKAGSGETYSVKSNDYWEGVETYSFDAYTAKRIGEELYVEAETLARLFGFDIHVGDGLLLISSGPYDQVKNMYLYPLHWDKEYDSPESVTILEASSEAMEEEKDGQ